MNIEESSLYNKLSTYPFLKQNLKNELLCYIKDERNSFFNRWKLYVEFSAEFLDTYRWLPEFKCLGESITKLYDIEWKRHKKYEFYYLIEYILESVLPSDLEIDSDEEIPEIVEFKDGTQVNTRELMNEIMLGGYSHFIFDW